MEDFERAFRGRVLVADDNPEIRSLLASLIEWEGWQVIHAADGRETLIKLIKEQPDVLVLDYRMPGLNGKQVCDRMRELGLRVPVILMTAEGSAVQLACDCHAEYLLAKPFSCSTLISILERLQVGSREGR